MFALGFEETTDIFLSSVRKSRGIALFGALGAFAVDRSDAHYDIRATSQPCLNRECPSLAGPSRAAC